jgi:hypothetical protein
LLLRPLIGIRIENELRTYAADFGKQLVKVADAMGIRRARMGCFTGLDYQTRVPEAFEALGRWRRDGSLVHKEDVAYGLENAPKALLRLFSGEKLALPPGWHLREWGFGRSFQELRRAVVSTFSFSCELESAAKPIGFIHLLDRLGHSPRLGHQSRTSTRLRISPGLCLA